MLYCCYSLELFSSYPPSLLPENLREEKQHKLEKYCGMEEAEAEEAAQHPSMDGQDTFEDGRDHTHAAVHRVTRPRGS